MPYLRCRICYSVLESESPFQSQCYHCGGDASHDRITVKEFRTEQRLQAAMAEDDTTYATERPERATHARQVDDIEDKDFKRLVTGEPDIDRVTGGGFVCSAMYALHSPPGCGKSKLALRIAARLCKRGPVLFCSTTSEMRERRIKLMLRNSALVELPSVRSGGVNGRGNLYILDFADDADKVADLMEQVKPVFVVADSISTVWKEEVKGDRGGKMQIRYAMELWREIIEKRTNASFLALLHETKDGKSAGPGELAFLFDTMLRMQRVEWMAGGTAPSGRPIPGKFVPTQGDEVSKYVKFGLGSGGKGRDGDPTAFQVYELQASTLVAVDAPREAGMMEGIETTRVG
jgi:predicted ATP-dependent serine protease